MTTSLNLCLRENKMKVQQMDLKTFSDNDFDPKKWINKAWSSSSDQEREVFVANTVCRLQLYMKQLTNSLDEATTQIVTSLPRVLQDASVLQEEALQLQQNLLSLEQKVLGVEQQTGHSIESLQRIDRLKSRLENAALTLHEADKWAALTSSLENVLEAGVPTSTDKLAELAGQVASMTQSLELMVDASDYDSKRVQLETLYNRLEAAISPSLIEALTQMDSGRTETYVCLYRGMSRSTSVWRCWRRAAAARLATTWRSLDTHSIPALTGLLATDAGRQMDWLTSVLKSESPLAELVRLYTDLLLSLEPSPTKIVSANLKLCVNAEEGLILLTDLKRDIDRFVATIREIVDAPKVNKETLNAQIERDFGRAAYAPLRELLPKYTELQTQLLNQHLSNKDLEQVDLQEHSRTILSIVEQCEDWLTSAFTRSKKIGGVAAYPYYVPAVENFISSLSSLISAHSRRIETDFLTSVSAMTATGVLSDTFSSSLVLEAATSTLIDVILNRNKVETGEPLLNDGPPLQDLATLLLDNEGKQRLEAFRADPPLSVATLRRIKEQMTTLAKNILKQPVESQLEKIPRLPVWSNNDALSTDLPDFALSPQEYITEVGQYLMTLPQHLEMHLSEKQAPWQFLSEVCVHTCEVYAEKILNIRNMDELGTKRCLTDIVYLSSVVDDLGTSIAPALKSLENSLRSATPQPSNNN